MHGREKNGAPAALNSVAKLSYRYCKDGISAYISLVRGTWKIRKTSGMTTRIHPTATSVRMAHHLNVNVMNRETLD